MLRIDGDRIIADTRTLTATIERGIITSLTRKSDGKPLIQAPAEGAVPLQLVYGHQEAVPLGTEPGDCVTLLPVSEHRAEFRVESWHGDGLIAVSEDAPSGELIVEPSGYASRPGLRACRWTIAGIASELKLAAPLWQGVRLALTDPIIHDQHFAWPFEWQAGLAILDGDAGSGTGGFWVHCQDDRYRYKALHIFRNPTPRGCATRTRTPW